jgi:hypothetical protein
VVVRAFVRRVMRSCLAIKAGLKDALGRSLTLRDAEVKRYSNGYSRLTAPGAKRPLMRQVATTKLAVDRQIEHG